MRVNSFKLGIYCIAGCCFFFFENTLKTYFMIWRRRRQDDSLNDAKFVQKEYAETGVSIILYTVWSPTPRFKLNILIKNKYTNYCYTLCNNTICSGTTVPTRGVKISYYKNFILTFNYKQGDVFREMNGV